MLLLLFMVLVLSSCSSGNSSDNYLLCRNYSTSSISSLGITQTCNYDSDTRELNCATDSGASYSTYYSSNLDFILESKIVGSIKSSSRIYPVYTVIYTYERGRLVASTTYEQITGTSSLNTEVSYSQFDEFNRPTTGETVFSSNPECLGTVVSFTYNDVERIVVQEHSFPSGCSGTPDLETSYDLNGNIIESGSTDFKTQFTIQETEEVCVNQ